MNPIRMAYLRAAAAAADLLDDPALPPVWDAPSALPEMRTSGLAGHLALQVLRVPEKLAAAPAHGEPIALLDHYSQVTWVDADLDDEINVVIRSSAEEAASVGPGQLAAGVRAAAADLESSLAAEPATRAVDVPGWTWTLSLDDFLITRMMEVAVHSDDLAVSLGIATPELPAEVMEPVLDLLSRLAARRHGSVALMRALSRAERAPAAIAAF